MLDWPVVEEMEALSEEPLPQWVSSGRRRIRAATNAIRFIMLITFSLSVKPVRAFLTIYTSLILISQCAGRDPQYRTAGILPPLQKDRGRAGALPQTFRRGRPDGLPPFIEANTQVRPYVFHQIRFGQQPRPDHGFFSSP